MKKETKKTLPGELKIKKPRRSFGVWLDAQVDSLAYVGGLIAFSVLSVGGIKMYLSQADQTLVNVFAVSFVACLFYITLRNR